MASRQKAHGGGKFKSENQRRAMWARAPAAARKWAHNVKTRAADWRGMRSGGKGGVKRAGRAARGRRR